MKISMPVKIIVGLLTAWVVITPFIFIGGWFFFVFSMAATQSSGQQNPDVIPVFFVPFIFLIICTSVLHICLQAFYLVHLILNKSGSDVVRAILGVGIIVLPFLAMAVYYFVYILPDNPPQWALTTNLSQAPPTGHMDSPNSPSTE